MTRGMDVEGVRNVINYDLPPYIKTYIHRAGACKSRARLTPLYLVKKSRELENRVASLDNSTSKKMNQLKTTISKSTNLFRLNPNQALPILQTHHFCSATPATEQPPTSPPKSIHFFDLPTKTDKSYWNIPSYDGKTVSIESIHALKLHCGIYIYSGIGHIDFSTLNA
ncbi:hypothetical protein Syun_016000 [Stephania yunnanensis]|uniref:Helicase C-terminal domain-containing protein n=1 Tax=Stephania yunnanensis TaxID=152371 RepID=A0AAP0J6C1_9MAGN